MLGHFGFSYIGLLFLLMLFVPNILWTQKQPESYSPADENKFLLTLERIGEVLVTCTALIFRDFNLASVGLWSMWLLAAFVLLALYEICWIRYFRNPTLENFYRRFLGIPIPLATLPVAAFFLLGIYGKVIWMLIAVTLLGIGHLGIHFQHCRKANIR